jgi:hypothetical protein
MKKHLIILLTLFLVAVFAGPALAKSDNAWGQQKKLINTQELQNQAQSKGKVQKQIQKPKPAKEQKKEKGIKERVKPSLQVEYKAALKVTGNSVKALPFSDVNSHWASGCIRLMYAVGLFQGYPDGTFKPDKQLTQAEALSLVMRITADDDADTTDDDAAIEEDDQDELDDVPAWVRHDARKACKKGIIKLNRFHSAVQASRAQTAVMIAKALGLEPVDTKDMPFKDGLLISKDDVGYILVLYQEGIITGTPNGYFNPNCAITRAEMAIILQKLLDQNEIESISLPATATVEQGKSITLKATVKYADGSTDNNVTWSSSDTALATVENGVVTAATDKLGTVTITATAAKGESTKSATCTVTVVKEDSVMAGTMEATGNIGSHEGKVYEEYVLKVDGETISLDEDNVKAITLQKDDEKAVELTPNTDTSLWFNVQRESGQYTLTVTDQNDKKYSAVIDWTAPTGLVAYTTGNEGEHDGNTYVEYGLSNMDLSSFTAMYQIKPDGQVVELSANSDKNLWFKTSNQIPGTHIFLIKKNDVWYSASISI